MQTFSNISQDNVEDVYDFLFAPWVKELGLIEIEASKGRASAIMPQNSSLFWSAGAICGQAILAAIDTVASLAVNTTDRQGKGTVSQNTQFIRPAFTEDLKIEVSVLNFGRTIAYAEAKVTFVESGKLVAHSTLEFAF
jgi:uncharacterized protein (TIGR00369 family)